MEQVVEVLGIEDYSVSQTTLDNVSQRVTYYLQEINKKIVNISNK